MKIHFIGIGGIGVSALARYYLAKGYEVSGSDLVSSEITKALEKLGAKIFIGKHKAKNLPKDADLVIYSPAIEEKNPELKKAKKLKIKCQSYPQALGELTKNHFTIAVCGSHGKSTVAAMIGLILTKAKFNPTVILGTKLKEFGDSNCRIGKVKIFSH
jgi:UDP-N-acetylmuramate--alanine ligase